MEQFTNLYQLTKTLKFKLEPHQGNTAKPSPIGLMKWHVKIKCRNP